MPHPLPRVDSPPRRDTIGIDLHACHEPALLEALKAVIDPNTGKDFVSTKQLQEPAHRGRRRRIRRRARLSGEEPAAEGLRKALIAAARSVPGVANVSANVGDEGRRRTPCSAACSCCRSVQEHRRRRVRQGRRRQEHDRGQPRARARRRGREGRHPRRRHLRPEPADDDGHRRPARVGRRQDHGADGELRRPGDVDRLPGRGRQPDDLARPDGDPGARAAAAADATGASSTT